MQLLPLKVPDVAFAPGSLLTPSGLQTFSLHAVDLIAGKALPSPTGLSVPALTQDLALLSAAEAMAISAPGDSTSGLLPIAVPEQSALQAADLVAPAPALAEPAPVVTAAVPAAIPGEEPPPAPREPDLQLAPPELLEKASQDMPAEQEVTTGIELPQVALPLQAPPPSVQEQRSAKSSPSFSKPTAEADQTPAAPLKSEPRAIPASAPASAQPTVRPSQESAPEEAPRTSARPASLDTASATAAHNARALPPSSESGAVARTVGSAPTPAPARPSATSNATAALRPAESASASALSRAPGGATLADPAPTSGQSTAPAPTEAPAASPTAPPESIPQPPAGATPPAPSPAPTTERPASPAVGRAPGLERADRVPQASERAVERRSNRASERVTGPVTSAPPAASQPQPSPSPTSPVAAPPIESPGPDPQAPALPSALSTPAAAAPAPFVQGETRPLTDTPPPSPPITLASPRFAEEVSIAIARRPGGLAPGDELVLQIEPADMGRIRVELRFAPDGGLEAVVSADQPRVLDQLRSHSAELHRSLLEAGGRADIAAPRFEARQDGASLPQQGGQGSSLQQGGSHSGGAGQQQGQQQARAGFLYPPDTAAPLPSAERHRLTSASGRLDLIA